MEQGPRTCLADGIGDWLLGQGLGDASLKAIVHELGQRLVAAGIALHRLSIGGMILHPVYGAHDVVWEAQGDRVTDQVFPRSMIHTREFQQSPFFHASSNGIPLTRVRLEQGPAEPEFPLYDRLREAGLTDYILFYRDYGRKNLALWAGLPQGLEGAIGSFATTRAGGFTDAEAEALQALVPALALVVKAKVGQELTRELLDTYVGRQSGQQVLHGLIERGAGRVIDCALWYSDLRDSTALAERMEMQDYLDLLDAYFDCTAGAVLKQGGEVLKFIGDAVMAIFPFTEKRPPAEACRAALAAARRSLARADRRNQERHGQPPIRFGVALHVGEVLYGNVGTDRRLDFTVTGPAANEATRLESLCKTLGVPLLASARFRANCEEPLASLGQHAVPGVAERLEAFEVACSAMRVP